MTVRLHTPAKGMDFARMVMAICVAKGDAAMARHVAARRWGDEELPALILRSNAFENRLATKMAADRLEDALEFKAVVAGGSTTGWADDLAFARAAGEFIEAVRSVSIVGRLRPFLRTVPLNTRVAVQSTKPSGYWVKEGKAKPVSRFTIGTASLAPLKIASLVVATDELVKHSDPAAEELFRRELVVAMAETLDSSFLDPDNAGVTDTEPASITNSVTPVESQDNTEAALDASLLELIFHFEGDLERAVFVATPQTFVRFHSAEHQDCGARGGSLLGVPCLASKGAPRDSLILLDPGRIAFGERETEVRVSRQATIAMSDAPTADGVAGTGESLVSCFQTDMSAILAEHVINWDAQEGAVEWFRGIMSSGFD